MQGVLAIVSSTDVAVVKFRIDSYADLHLEILTLDGYFDVLNNEICPLKQEGKIRMRRITLLHMYNLVESITLDLVKDMHTRY